MSKELENLKSENILLRNELFKQESFIDTLFKDILPVATEIGSAKGIFKVFKVFKLAIYLCALIFKHFDNKPKKIDWY
jgi:hypothetical protein